jgi:peroxiredoxin Q/BCP
MECKSFRENGTLLKKTSVAYFTAGTDSIDTNKRFAESLELDYPILCDPEKAVARAYGVVHGIRLVPERWTFYIDKQGIIVHIDTKVKAATAAEDVLQKLKELKWE